MRLKHNRVQWIAARSNAHVGVAILKETSLSDDHRTFYTFAIYVASEKSIIDAVYSETGILVSPLGIIRRFSDKRMVEEMVFRTPLADLFYKLRDKYEKGGDTNVV